MKKLFVTSTWFLFIFAMPFYGAKGVDFYAQSVLAQYFYLDIPDSFLNEKSIPRVIDFLKKNSVKAYEKGKCRYTESYYGTFHFQKGGEQQLWLYRNNNVHSGVFAIFNSNLEITYLNTHMGCLYDLEVRDFLHDGNDILMVTHGAGGTGIYTKLTDLIKNQNGAPELTVSLLKEMQDCNIRYGGDAAVCIDCYTRSKDFEHLTSVRLKNGHRAIRIETVAEAKLDSSSVTPKERIKINNFLNKNYGLGLDNPLVNATTIMIENLDDPIIHVSHSSICPGYVAPGYAWPGGAINKAGY